MSQDVEVEVEAHVRYSAFKKMIKVFFNPHRQFRWVEGTT